MRKIVNLNRKWAFSKAAAAVPEAIDSRWDFVNLPHSWNALDGQEGGAEYYRGTAWYAKEIYRESLPEAEKYFIEFSGANSIAEFYVNGVKKMRHEGGFSTWRCDITKEIKAGPKTLLAVAVDNGVNDKVYPQMRDFTIYGGLHRDVKLICVGKSHFDLHYQGSPAIRVTPIMNGRDALVKVRTFVTNRKEHHRYQYLIRNGDGSILADVTGNASKAQITILNAHLWNGRKDPYLYSVQVNLLDADEILDSVSTRFGCRSFYIDPDKGFILNGAEYPLRGVSLYQDRWEVGNGLLPAHQKEDLDLICEMGANVIHLAGHQHDQYFYDLCDERGMILWTEIPYSGSHMSGGRENTLSQMGELVHQNYNHPSIVVWGLSNALDGKAADNPELLENHRALSSLVYELDKTRMTTMAVSCGCPMDAHLLSVPDVVSYHQAFSEPGEYAPWFDKFHAKHPNTPIGCSGYGIPAEGMTQEESAQAAYHEAVIKALFGRKYIWATYAAAMFDFGTGGVGDGCDPRGLVTFDRKHKKDAFYAYKAWLSQEPFVHICGKENVDRAEQIVKLTVYSNQRSVELFANGKSLGLQEAQDRFFRFEVPNVGQTHLLAVAGDCRDEALLHRTEEDFSQLDAGMSED